MLFTSPKITLQYQRQRDSRALQLPALGAGAQLCAGSLLTKAETPLGDVPLETKSKLQHHRWSGGDESLCIPKNTNTAHAGLTSSG